MANELTIVISQFQFSKTGSPLISRNPGQILRDVAGKNAVHGSQTIGTTEEALAKGDIGTVGYIMAKNNDNVNFVEIGTTGATNNRLLPGDWQVFRLNGAPYAKANVANVDIEYILIEA